MDEIIKLLKQDIADCRVNDGNCVDNTDDVSYALATLETLIEAINYTHCSLQLKDKYNENFAYFVEKKVRKQTVGSIYWYKDTGYTSLDKLFKEYQKLTKPLIV
tara:strand:- start:69951 stop:70262 length:312 start_codon:yes stop_codon:yes gene_type:complete